MNKKILIIDDDQNFRQLMSVFLSESGFEVDSADSGREGVKKALSMRPDLVLLDYNLGDMNGHDAAFWIKNMAATRAIPIIVLSAAASDPSLSQGLLTAKACKSVLSKTLALESMLLEIIRVLELKSG
ncbi:MAG: response regulator [Elusimicrobiales bacterium]|nr:response regulator [Elusimicrobiales bacterium]